jgi:hypothetical protein
MVAGTCHFYPVTDRNPHHICRRFGHRSIHLHSFLMKDKHLGTMLVFVLVLIILFLNYHNIKLLYAALIVGAIGLFVPALSRKIHDLWMKFAELLGLVMNKVILGIVFYLFLFPVALLSRLFRKNPFKAKKETSSYFSERNFTYTKKSLEQLW